MSSIVWGAPQGSILGPLLLLIYVNDILIQVKCNLLLFADNAHLVFQSDNVKDIENQLNQDLTNIWGWFFENKLKYSL